MLESKHKPDCGLVVGRLWVFVYMSLSVHVCLPVCVHA